MGVNLPQSGRGFKNFARNSTTGTPLQEILDPRLATHELQNNQLLNPKFKDILLTLVSGDLKGYEHAVNNIYQELICKLCNTRLNEFIITHKLNAANSHTILI